MRARLAMADQRGFTLAELLVVCALVGLVMAGVVALLMSGNQAYMSGINTLDAQQSARMGLARMVTDLREAGYCPTKSPTATACPWASNPDAFIATTATSFTAQYDWDSSGDITTGTVTDIRTGLARGEQVGYRLTGTTLERMETGVMPAWTTMASGVQTLSIQYFDRNGLTTTTATAVRAALITMTVDVSPTAAAALGKRQVTMTARVRLRNR
jgi:prepilin-type N-terminal cleavage/methylation domain-containing protein